MKHSAVPSALYAHCSPRSYDVGLLFCIRAINLAWQDAIRAHADQAVSQWMLQRVCYFHVVTDEGPNPRRPCPTDVEMQPLRELSSSASPQRTASASLSQAPVHAAGSTGHNGGPFTPQAADPHAVDFSVIASGGVGAECGSDVLSLSRISALDSSCQQTPQPERQHPFPARSSGRHIPRGGSSVHRVSMASQGGAADDGPLLEGHRHPLHNKGFALIHELLLLCLDVDERLFCTMVEAFLAVLPRSNTTHAEISLAMFENYPYIAPTPPPASAAAGDPPDVLLQASDNAAGNAMKSFLVYMNIAFNAGSFERQCDVLEMCKVWREWLHEAFAPHIAFAITTAGASSGGPSPPRQGSQRDEVHHHVTSRSILQEGSYEDSSLMVERLVHDAMLAKDVHGVANTVHRYYEHRLGADGTGRAMLEVLLHPSMAPPPPTHPLAFLFGVPPAAAPLHGQRTTAPPPSAEAFPVGGGGTSAHATDIHAAISCGILTFGFFYLSVRSTAAALRCADMAVLNGHQSGYVDTLALAHLLRSRCHAAAGAPSAAAEDISIALQLATASPTATQSDWWRARALAFHAAAELLIFYPGAVDATLRGALMQNPLASFDADAGDGTGGRLRSFLATRSSAQSGGAAATDGINSKSDTTIEVIQSLAQTVRHTLWCADVALLEECSAGLSFQAVAAVTANTVRIASSCLGVAAVVPPLSEAQVGATMAILEEDRLVMPEVRIACSANTVVLEYAKQAVMLVVQQLLGEYDPCPVPQCMSTQAHQHMSSPRATTMMQPFESLLGFVANKDGNTDVLDRCFYFAIAVEVAASYALFAKGYVALANARIGAAIAHLMAPQSNDPSLALHWPCEALLLLVASTKLHTEVLLFLGSIDLARRTVDTALGVFTQCVFARGIMQCQLLQASIWQRQRNRAEQVRLLTLVRDASRAIGYLPISATAQLRLVAAHLAAGDMDAASEAHRIATQQPFTHLLRRDAAAWLLHNVHTLVLASSTPHAAGADRLHDVVAVHDELCRVRARGMLPFATDLSVSHTLSTLLRACGSSDRDLTSTASRRRENVLAAAHQVLEQVKQNRHTDFMRGLGDSLAATCACITSCLSTFSAP